MKKGNLNRNKGFSLIELIIVIAIAAILVAIMVPVLFKYIEKTNVSSDTQLADTVRSAFLCAVTDARVLSDPDSAPYIADLKKSYTTNLVNGNIIVTITGTDRTGKKDTSPSTSNNDIVVD